MIISVGPVVELVDALDSKSSIRKGVGVRFSPGPPNPSLPPAKYSDSPRGCSPSGPLLWNSHFAGGREGFDGTRSSAMVGVFTLLI